MPPEQSENEPPKQLIMLFKFKFLSPSSVTAPESRKELEPSEWSDLWASDQCRCHEKHHVIKSFLAQASYPRIQKALGYTGVTVLTIRDKASEQLNVTRECWVSRIEGHGSYAQHDCLMNWKKHST
jgi:hypothetical protein